MPLVDKPLDFIELSLSEVDEKLAKSNLECMKIVSRMYET